MRFVNGPTSLLTAGLASTIGDRPSAIPPYAGHSFQPRRMCHRPNEMSALAIPKTVRDEGSGMGVSAQNPVIEHSAKMPQLAIPPSEPIVPPVRPIFMLSEK